MRVIRQRNNQVPFSRRPSGPEDFAGPLGRRLNGRDRAAFTILELILALGLLAVFCGVFVPVLAATTRERRTAAQEQAALQHAANLLEQLTTLSIADLKSSPEKRFGIPPEIKALLPEVEQAVHIHPLSGEASEAQVTVSIRWQSAAGTLSRPVILSAWVHEPGAAQ